MAQTDYELMERINVEMPHTFNSLQQLVMRMADYNKNKNNWTWWGKNKARKMWARFEEELKNTITSMYLDEIIERNASSEKTRENLYMSIEIFAQAFPNWNDAYSFAEQFFKQSPDKANQLIDAVRE